MTDFNRNKDIDSDADTDVDSGNLLHEQEQEELAELEVGDRIREEAEEEGGWDRSDPDIVPDPESTVPETATTQGAVVPRPQIPSVPVAPALGKTGDVLWGQEAAKSRPHSELDDLFEVPDFEQDNDVYTDDLFEIDESDVEYEDDDDLSDLTRVTEEDVMGSPPKIRPKVRKVRRHYQSYPQSMGGMR